MMNEQVKRVFDILQDWMYKQKAIRVFNIAGGELLFCSDGRTIINTRDGSVVGCEWVDWGTLGSHSIVLWRGTNEFSTHSGDVFVLDVDEISDVVYVE